MAAKIEAENSAGCGGAFGERGRLARLVPPEQLIRRLRRQDPLCGGRPPATCPIDLDHPVAEARTHIVDDQLLAGAFNAVPPGPSLVFDFPHRYYPIAPHQRRRHILGQVAEAHHVVELGRQVFPRPVVTTPTAVDRHCSGDPGRSLGGVAQFRVTCQVPHPGSLMGLMSCPLPFHPLFCLGMVSWSYSRCRPGRFHGFKKPNDGQPLGLG